MSDGFTYRHWTREGLTNALVQAEGDLRTLMDENARLHEEAERYHVESRNSAKTLGGILRVLRENDIEVHPAPGRPVRVEPKEFHQRHAAASDSLGSRCVCGAQWLEQSNRCVTQGPTAIVNPIHVTRAE